MYTYVRFDMYFEQRAMKLRPAISWRPAREADNLTAICEPIVWKMWEPRRLTTLWVFTACYLFICSKLGKFPMGTVQAIRLCSFRTRGNEEICKDLCLQTVIEFGLNVISIDNIRYVW
jgi:hypothetical protein